MGETFKVRVDGVQFDAAHFATYGGNCEPLHGHTYQVAAEVEGELVRDSWVVDFRRLKSLLRRLSKQLDHRFLLQQNSRLLRIEDQEEALRIRTPVGLEYVIPRQDVVLLPIDNSTSERLSQWFAVNLWQSLVDRRVNNLCAVTLEVYEGPGQRATHRLERLPLD